MMNKHFFEKGFTLVEMAFVVLIMGLIVGSVFSFLDVQQEEKKQQVTLERQKKISVALAVYAQMMGRLPCPGAPDATPLGTQRTACTTPETRDGIVPYRLLGLSQRDAMDGYGNPITYAVDIRAARQTTVNVAHANCRVTNKWVIGSVNVNTAKAYFCCQQIDSTTQLLVYSNAALTILLTPSPHTNTDAAAPTTNASAVSGATLGYTAYILISHGQNALGAYVFDQPNRRTLTNAGTAEQENADNDRQYVDIPKSTTLGTAFFDDIVTWRTQEGVISELSNDSCSAP